MFNKLTSNKLIAIFILTITTLTGCVAVSGMAGFTLKAYEGPEKKDVELVLLTDAIRNNYNYAVLAKVDDIVYGDDAFLGWPSKVQILPGSHTITVRCFAGEDYKFPYIKMTFEAGRQYDLLCKQESFNHVRAVILPSFNSLKIN